MLYIVRKAISIAILFLLLCENTVFSQQEQNNEIIQKHVQYNTFFSLGMIEMKAENYAQAILYFDSASAIFPHFHKPYDMTGACAVKGGMFDKSYEYFTKLILTGTFSD